MLDWQRGDLPELPTTPEAGDPPPRRAVSIPPLLPARADDAIAPTPALTMSKSLSSANRLLARKSKGTPDDREYLLNQQWT